MKKIFLKALLAVAVPAALYSCSDDALDTAPYNQLASGNMWTSETLCESGVAGAYASLKGWGPAVGNAGGAGNFLFDVLGTVGQANYDNNGGFFRTGVTAGNSICSTMWVKLYQGVYRSNDCITNISQAPISDDVRGRLVAEAKSLRALYYMTLNALYGGDGLGVPYYEENVAASEYTRGQTPEMEVWANIIQDLTDAVSEPNLPENYVDKKDGKISRGAAYALRGKAYLYRAMSEQRQGQDGSADFRAAAADFEKVGQCGYALYHPTGTAEDYRKLFKVEAENSCEMIFSVQYIEEPTKAYGINRKFQSAFQCGGEDNAGSWTDIQVNPRITDYFENADGTPFSWDAKIPGYTATPLAAREVYFLRDRQKNGQDIHSKVTSAVNSKLNSAALSSSKTKYLPEGNEARIRSVYAHRDPRLRMSIICPYDTMAGINYNPGHGEQLYVERWPLAAGKAYSVLSNGQPNSALVPGILPDLAANNSQLMYLYRKFIGEGLEFAYRQSTPIDEPLIRYADVLLMWAEALVETGDLKGAQDKVAQVRSRVKMPTLATNFSDKDTARKYVRDERRREFVGEGINFFDEMRWRTLRETRYDTTNPLYEAGYNALKVWGSNLSGFKAEWPGDFYYVWAVPKAEQDKNPNLTKTPGWIY